MSSDAMSEVPALAGAAYDAAANVLRGPVSERGLCLLFLGMLVSQEASPVSAHLLTRTITDGGAYAVSLPSSIFDISWPR
jgi:hypothetical protein